MITASYFYPETPHTSSKQQHRPRVKVSEVSSTFCSASNWVLRGLKSSICLTLVFFGLCLCPNLDQWLHVNQLTALTASVSQKLCDTAKNRGPVVLQGSELLSSYSRSTFIIPHLKWNYSCGSHAECDEKSAVSNGHATAASGPRTTVRPTISPSSCMWKQQSKICSLTALKAYLASWINKAAA